MSSTHILRYISLLIFVSVLVVSPYEVSFAVDVPDLYFVDAHSQMAKGLDPNKIIPLMDKAGVWHTILSARNDRSPSDVADFAAKHPDRITAFNQNTPKFKKLINRQLEAPNFKALAEVIMFHAQKGKKAPRISVEADSPQVQMLLNIAIDKKWPFIAHYEYRALGWSKSKHMDSFESMMQANPNQPFMLIHMGQLDVDDVERLIASHNNVHFIMSHSNPISIGKNPGQPWTNLFKGERLAPKWLDVILKNPERFVLAFDNVWPEYWGSFYIKQATLWRNALADLPIEIAHSIAHGNAERLWNLPRK